MNVTELLDRHRIGWTDSHKDVRQGWVAISSGCPWCGRRNGELYLAVNLASATAACWRCGRHSLADVLAACGNMPLKAAIDAAKAVTRVAVAARPPGKLKPPDGVTELGRAHATYLRQRGFDPVLLVQLWGLQAIGLTKRLPWRIYIPIYDRDGWEVSWSTRAIGDRALPRYHTASPEEEAVSNKSLLYGEQYCRHAVIVHEGPTDVWATGPGAVATLGLAVTPAQISRLAGYLLRVICFDAEPEAQQRARRLADILAPFPGETLVACLETGKDPATADKSEILGMRAAYLGENLFV